MKKPKLLQNIGITICAIGGLITIGTLGLGAKLGLPVIIAGSVFILANWILTKAGKSTLTAHIIITSILSASYILLLLNYTKTTVLRVNDITKAKELVIICGAEGYDALPNYTWWTREIEMPINNILVTSTEFDNISTRITVVDDKGSKESNYNQGYGQEFCAGPLNVIKLNSYRDIQKADWTFSKSVSDTIIQLCTKKRLKLP